MLVCCLNVEAERFNTTDLAISEIHVHEHQWNIHPESFFRVTVSHMVDTNKGSDRRKGSILNTIYNDEIPFHGFLRVNTSISIGTWMVMEQNKKSNCAFFSRLALQHTNSGRLKIRIYKDSEF